MSLFGKLFVATQRLYIKPTVGGISDGKELKMFYSERMALNAEIERLKAENERLTERLKQVLLSIDTVKEMNAMCSIDEQRKQTVKEFAEKLKNKLFVFFQDNEELDGKISLGSLYAYVIGVEAEDGTIISLGLIDELLKEINYEKSRD